MAAITIARMTATADTIRVEAMIVVIEKAIATTTESKALIVPKAHKSKS